MFVEFCSIWRRQGSLGGIGREGESGGRGGGEIIIIIYIQYVVSYL